MIQHTKPVRTIECAGCHGHPLHVHTRGKNVHHIECPRCGTRTAPTESRELALREWSRGPKERISLLANRIVA